MGQLVFTFSSPKCIEETKIMINGAINQINGTVIKEKGNIIKAKWRSKGFLTVLPVEFTFFVGQDMVRVIMAGAEAGLITAKRNTGGKERVWEEFIKKLTELNPSIVFGLKAGVAEIDAIRFIGDGTEQVYTSTTIHRETWFDSWMSIGSTTAETKFSNKVLAVVRYTNGATFEGELSKKSPVYHEIMANMSLYKTTIR